jgi:hypothetical protein
MDDKQTLNGAILEAVSGRDGVSLEEILSHVAGHSPATVARTVYEMAEREDIVLVVSEEDDSHWFYEPIVRRKFTIILSGVGRAMSILKTENKVKVMDQVRSALESGTCASIEIYTSPDDPRAKRPATDLDR